MTEGWDEIEAAVYAVVLDVLAIEATLIPEVLLELLVNVVSHWLPAKAETHRGVQSLRQSVTADRVTQIHSGLSDALNMSVPFSVVHSVPKPRGIHNGEFQFDTFLLYIHRVFGDFYSLCDSL